MEDAAREGEVDGMDESGEEPEGAALDDDCEDREVETVDGIPVPADVTAVEGTHAELVALERLPTAPPALQVAAAAATGFVAGAATMALMRRAGRRAPASGPLRPVASGDTRTYLVRVRLISRP